ncbi:MAG: DNA-directed RNA polymerase subunit K [Nanoarchaeota archaeon]
MILEKFEDKFTKYEIARILGARSLQLAMDAPVLLKMTKEEEEELNYDTLKIAEKEFEAEVLPITVRRPLPKKSGKSIKKLSEEEIRERLEKQAKIEKEVKEEKTEDKETESGEIKEEKEISEEGEIMELATPEDETSEEAEEETEEI